ncbi:MAG: CHASE2 domain-containing protein [Hyphomicrobiales bacterium]
MTKSRVLALLFGLAVLTSLVILRGADPLLVSVLREQTLDQFQRLSPRPHVEQPVRVVDIDEAALAEFGQWPWPRDRLADLVDKLDALGAAVIAFDMAFAEPDRLSPARIIQGMDLDPLLGDKAALVSALRDNDRAFAEAMTDRPVVLSFAIAQGAGAVAPKAKAGFALSGERTIEALPRFEWVTPVVPELEAAAQGLGNMSLSPGQLAGTIRRMPLMLTDGSTPYPNLALEALRLAVGASTYVIRGAADSPATVEDIRIADLIIPTTAAGELWLYYRPDSPDLYVPVGDVFNGRNEADLRQRIEGHIVLIGTSATGLIDIRPTALAENVPGVSIHAQAIEQILSGSFLWRPDWVDGIEILCVVLIGLTIIVVTVFLGPLTSFAVGGAGALAVAAGSWLAFRDHGLLIDASFPLAAGMALHFSMTAYRYLVTDRDARFVRNAFARYVSPPVLAEIQKRPEMLKLGGEVRELTVMFVDVRNFTPISESLPPDQLVAFLNRLLGELSHCVVEEHGTIDKFIGDSLMAFWNAPVAMEDHQRQACLAALGMREAVTRLNAGNAFGFRNRGLADESVAIGIGVNTGRACVGNMGSQDRFDYSCIGDAVNLAARIEGACKQVNFDILVSEATAEALPDLALLDAGELPLKGKSARQRIYALVGDAETRADPAFVKLAARHDELLTALNRGRRDDADRLAGECLELSGDVCRTLAGFYRRLPDRLQDFHTGQHADVQVAQ